MSDLSNAFPSMQQVRDRSFMAYSNHLGEMSHRDREVYLEQIKFLVQAAKISGIEDVNDDFIMGALHTLTALHQALSALEGSLVSKQATKTFKLLLDSVRNQIMGMAIHHHSWKIDGD